MVVFNTIEYLNKCYNTVVHFFLREVNFSLFFRLENPEEIFFNQKQRADQREVSAELGEYNTNVVYHISLDSQSSM